MILFQLQLGEAAETLKYNNGVIKILISVDATPIWRASVTRADVYVDVHGAMPENQ